MTQLMVRYGPILSSGQWDDEYRPPGLGDGSVSFNYEEPMLAPSPGPATRVPSPGPAMRVPSLGPATRVPAPEVPPKWGETVVERGLRPAPEPPQRIDAHPHPPL
jgi:hypothetical protein